MHLPISDGSLALPGSRLRFALNDHDATQLRGRIVGVVPRAQFYAVLLQVIVRVLLRHRALQGYHDFRPLERSEEERLLWLVEGGSFGNSVRWCENMGSEDFAVLLGNGKLGACVKGCFFFFRQKVIIR